jgi:glycosidase
MRYKNEKIYEINARILIKKFQANTLCEIPDNYWQDLAELGIKYIWLMGVWKIPETSVLKYCFESGLVNEYKNALHNWTEKDVAGSPYAIEDYEINPCLGKSNEELMLLKKKLNELGLKLILDFIPNHFNAESPLLKTNPEIFLPGDEFLLEDDPKTFFRSPLVSTHILAHGKDPNFDAWQDTAQVNYFSREAKEFMKGRLLSVSKLCNGVRCDMAMLARSEVFANTWKRFAFTTRKSKSEFWKDAIGKIRKSNPKFLFIAEAYWNMEWDLQQLGFDYTYDKRLYDRLIEGNVNSIKDHFLAGADYQHKSLRFIENHDEKRALVTLGKEKSKAAAVLISTIPGISLFFEGQFTGKKIKLPVQLNREPYEETDEELQHFYEKLLSITKDFEHGEYEWNMLETFPAWEGNFTNSNFLAWQISGMNKNYIVCINYGEHTSQCRIKPHFNSNKDEIVFFDKLNNNEYTRETNDVKKNGLYVELCEYACHVFYME